MRAIRHSIAAILLLVSARASWADDQIPWQPNLETAQRVAAQTNRLILIHFWAPRCAPCMRLEQNVFQRNDVAEALGVNFVPVKINIDESPATARRYGISTIPTDVVLTPAGGLVTQLTSPANANQYVEQMNHVADGHRQLSQTPYASNFAPPAVASPSIVQNRQPAAPPQMAGPTARSVAPGAAAPRSAAGQFAAQPQPSVPPPAAGQAMQNNYAAAAPPMPGPPGEYLAERPQPEFHPSMSPPVTSQERNAGPPTWPRPQVAGGASPNGRPDASLAAVPPAVPAGRQAWPAGTAQAAPPTAPQSSIANGKPASRPVVSAPAGPPKLPPGSAPLALDGYCPVQLRDNKRWVAGDVRFGATHRGQTYLFASPAEQKKFLASPDRYGLMINGNDPVLAVDHRQSVPGRRDFGVVYEKTRMYLFASRESYDRFNGNPRFYDAEARKIMR